MKSLFLKIFIWFWAAMMLVSTTLVISAVILSTDSLLLRGRDRALSTLEKSGRILLALHEKDRKWAVERFLDRVQNESGNRLFLYSNSGELLQGISPPADARHLIQNVLISKKARFKILTQNPLIALPLSKNSLGERTVQVLSEGKGESQSSELQPHSANDYVVMAQLSESRLFQLFRPTLSKFLRLLSALTVSGVVCFFLARHMTTPILKFQTMAEKIAGGNFGDRVVPQLGGRRDEIYHLGIKFDEMAGKIEHLIHAQKELMRNVSHELRSPLTRLNVALELTRQKAPGEAEGSLLRIEREVDNMNRLIGQIITLSRFESDVAPLQTQPIDLGDMLEKIKTDADYEAGKKKCTVVLACQSNIIISGNYDLLYSAVENIVRNALRFTDENTSVELTLSQKENDDPQHRMAVIGIRDHGPGVPEEDLDKLFQPFFQVKSLTHSKVKNSGLGLAIAQSAVDRHRGLIKAVIPPDRGLEIIISIPLDVACVSKNKIFAQQDTA